MAGSLSVVLAVLRRRVRLIGALVYASMIRAVVPSSVIGLTVSTERGMFIVPKGDSYVARRMAQGGHDDHVLAEALRLTASGDQVLIVGAHVGAHAVPLAASGRLVVAIEANPDIFELLKLSSLLNGTNERIRFIQVAAGTASGTTEFWQGHTNTGGSKVRPSRRRFEYTFDRPTPIQVPTMRLDDLNLAFEQRIAVAIIDVEGSEGAVLSGMTRTLRSCDALIMEVCPAHLEDSGDLNAVQALVSDEFDQAVVVASGMNLEVRSVVSEVKQRFGDFAACDVLFTRDS